MNRGKVLGIETAIGGGSLAIVAEDQVLNTASERISRAEQAIIGINSILRDAKVEMQDISMIAVSIGPGSFTGIRIAIATAIGLARAAQIECVGVSLFEAIALTAETTTCGTVVSLGRGCFGFQRFSRQYSSIRPLSKPIALSETEMRSVLEAPDSESYMICGDHSLTLGLGVANVFDVTENLATLIAKRAMLVSGSTLLEPLYLGK